MIGIWLVGIVLCTLSSCGSCARLVESSRSGNLKDVPFFQFSSTRFSYSTQPVANWSVLPFANAYQLEPLRVVGADELFLVRTDDVLFSYTDGQFLPVKTNASFASGTAIATFDDYLAVVNADGVELQRCTVAGASTVVCVGVAAAAASIGSVTALLWVPSPGGSAAASGPDLWIGCSTGVLRATLFGGNPTVAPVPYLAGKPIMSLAARNAADGALRQQVAVGTAQAVYLFDVAAATWSYHWVGGLIDAPPTAMQYDAGGRLWIGNSMCVNWLDAQGGFERLGGLVENPGSLVGGLPYANITTMLAARDGSDMWIGSDKGFSAYVRDEWFYFFGPRYAPGNATRSIVATDSAVVWVATDGGLARIAATVFDSLEAKADYYQSLVEPMNDRFGLVSYVTLQRFGDPTSYVKVADESDGLWSSIYLAAQAYRYAVTGDPAVKALAWRTYEAMEFLHNVTGYAGLVARTYELNTTLPGSHWHQSVAYPEWIWMDGTSSDDFTGHLMVYPLIYDLVAETPQEKERVARLVQGITGYIVDNGFVYVDITGEPSRWGVWSPQYLNANSSWLEERGLNSLQMLSYLVCAYNVTGNKTFLGAFETLRTQYGYGYNMLNQRITASDDDDFSDDELAFMAYLPFIRYVDDSDARRQLKASMDRSFRIAQSEKSSFFNLVYGTIEPSNPGLADALQNLRDWPLEMIDWPTPNSHRLDIRFNRDAVYDDRAPLASVDVLPPSERQLMRWNLDPFQLDGGSGFQIMDPGAWLLPYWLARYHGFI